LVLPGSRARIVRCGGRYDPQLVKRSSEWVSECIWKKTHSITSSCNPCAGDLQAVGFKMSDVITSSILSTPPWLLTRPGVIFTLQCSDKSNTSPEIFKHRFYELCHEFKNYYRIFTDGSKEGNRVAAAVVHRDNTKCVRLPDTASIFRAQLYAVLLAIDVVRRSKEKNFVIFSDSTSSLQSIYGFNLDSDLLQSFWRTTLC